MTDPNLESMGMIDPENSTAQQEILFLQGIPQEQWDEIMKEWSEMMDERPIWGIPFLIYGDNSIKVEKFHPTD